MRVMILVRANAESEAGALPSTEMLAAMGKFNEELAHAGILLAAEGLQPSSKGVRVRFSAGEPRVTYGPYGTTQQLVAGFWIWNVRSMAEAISWIKRAPFGIGAEVDIRPIFEAEDFGAQLTPELREQEKRLRQELKQRKAS